VYRDLDNLTGIRAGAMYPALARLEAQHLIESGWATTQPGRRRRWYRTTNPT
jgi:DNA-binding PadR family transcriptional regulator